MVTRLVVLNSLAQHSGEKVEGVSAEVSPRLGYDFVAKRIILSNLQSLNRLLVEVA